MVKQAPLGTLSERRATILRIIVGDYIATAVPVGSQGIVRRYRLGSSAATVRHEMAALEEEGYVTQPHTSAGRIPMDKGYRYYVECLMEETELLLAEQRMLRHQFHQAPRDLEEWLQLAVAALSHLVENVALVTLPCFSQCRLRHLELVALEEFVVLLLLVLQKAYLKRQTLVLEEPITQDELSALAHRLTAAYRGLSSSEIEATAVALLPAEARIKEALVYLMRSEDQQQCREFYLEGLRHLLAQPEFENPHRLQQALELLEDRRIIGALLPEIGRGGGVTVVIGEEHGEAALQDYSMVVTAYGTPGQGGGALGVLGPTRMRYGRTISAVRHVASLMTELLEGF